MNDAINFNSIKITYSRLYNKLNAYWQIPYLIFQSMKCTESEEEEVSKGKESQLQLSCFINQEVKYLFTGLKLVRTIAVHPHCL